MRRGRDIEGGGRGEGGSGEREGRKDVGSGHEPPFSVPQKPTL